MTMIKKQIFISIDKFNAKNAVQGTRLQIHISCSIQQTLNQALQASELRISNSLITTFMPGLKKANIYFWQTGTWSGFNPISGRLQNRPSEIGSND